MTKDKNLVECKKCIHFEVCAYASHQLPICDSYAEKERHGHWDSNGWCSRCGSHAPYCVMDLAWYESPFCYECGAKMDGDNIDETD